MISLSATNVEHYPVQLFSLTAEDINPRNMTVRSRKCLNFKINEYCLSTEILFRKLCSHSLG